MSRSKDHFGGTRGRLIRVTTSRRCPICKSTKACSVSADGGRVLCTNIENGRRYDRGPKPFWIHTLGPTSAAEIVAAATPEAPEAERGDIELLDASYHALLAELTLSSAHEEHLVCERALSRAQIRASMIRTWPLEGRARIAQRWVERVGEPVARRTPGYRLGTEGGRSWVTLAGAPGLAVPAFDVTGKIRGIKNRRDGDGEGARYTWISSAKHGGPKAMQVVHVPPWFAGDRTSVVVTEGELKATTISALSGALAISVPGVGAWAMSLPVLKALGARDVSVAFDMDYLEKPEVAGARRDLVRALRRAGFACRTLSWDPSHKGFDDFLVARSRLAEAA